MSRKLWYYPGCTLKTKARNLERAAFAAAAKLDLELVELPRWNCCGVVFSLARDDLMRQIAPIRNLIRVKEQGGREVVALCAFCYNTLARANLLMRGDQEKLSILNDFMYEEETKYEGEVEVMHFLQILAELGWERIKEKVRKPLSGLRLAPYYGCALIRPEDVAIDSPERPLILHMLLDSLGAEVVDFPFSNQCCGSFQIVANPEAVEDAVDAILSSAKACGADAVVTSCPLCDYNLGSKQREKTPIFYFSQLLALALGVDPRECGFEENWGGASELLRARGLI